MKRRLFKSALVLAVISVSYATAAQLVPVQESVSTRIAPVSTSTTFQTVPVSMQSPRPPDLTIVSGGSPVRLGGFDYCWQAVGGESAVCADSFGMEVPLAATADDGSVDLKWMVGGTLTAWFSRDSVQCPQKLAVVALGYGRRRLSLPDEPGTYRIDFRAESPGGNTRFAVRMTSTVAGPLSNITPSADISVSVEQRLLTVEAELSDLGMESEAAVEFRSADDVVSIWTMSLVESGGGCGRLFGIVEIEDVAVLGELPLEGLLIVDDGPSRFELSFRWPDDFIDSYATGAMLRTSSE